MNGIKKITIIGVGLLGGSLGLALRSRGYTGQIIGLGRTQASLDRARERGCLDAGGTDPAVALAGAELVVMAAPVRTILTQMRDLAPHMPPAAVVTDVGSTKSQIVTAAAEFLAQPRRFVGSHPMAGSEKHGPEFAQADLFAGKPCVITSVADTDPQARQVVENLWRTVGMRLVHMTPQAHDQAVARVSHLPHALAVLLVETARREGGLDVASTGFRDTTRLAGGDATVWADIFLSNADAVRHSVDRLMKELDQFRDLLETQDRTGITTLLERARQLREQWMARQWSDSE